MEAERPSGAREGRRWKLALYVLGLLACAFGAAEWWARHRVRLPDFKDERRLFYEHDAELGWLPRKDSTSVARMSVEFAVRHNSQHFRDREHAPDPGKPALCVLGDSFVWGFDVEAEDRFTDRLQARLPGIEVYNMGVSGYSTDQELLLLQRCFERYRPELVLVLVSCDPDGDDRKANASNKAYRYFKPRFVPRAGEPAASASGAPAELALEGVPVPRNASWRIDRLPAAVRWSHVARWVAARWPEPAEVRGADPTHAILARMRAWLAERGARLVVAKNDPDPALAAFCAEQALPLIDLAFIDGPHRFPSYGRHWTAEGHALAAEALLAGLAEHLPAADGR